MLTPFAVTVPSSVAFTHDGDEAWSDRISQAESPLNRMVLDMAPLPSQDAAFGTAKLSAADASVLLVPQAVRVLQPIAAAAVRC